MKLFCLAVLTLAAAFGTWVLAEPAAFPCGHAHNDYEHARPLLDALDKGFCSVEADIHLVDGILLVAHDLADAVPTRTLTALYLGPLRERARNNGGRIYPSGGGLTLLIDIKTDAEQTYAALRKVLAEYSDILTVFRGTETKTNAVTAILSGNRPASLRKESPRYAALDGRPADLAANPPIELVPLISEDWNRMFGWRGLGDFPKNEREQLARFVAQAHGQRRKVRFWATSDRVEVWEVLTRAGVDLINTDDLAGLRKFLDQDTSKSVR